MVYYVSPPVPLLGLCRCGLATVYWGVVISPYPKNSHIAKPNTAEPPVLGDLSELWQPVEMGGWDNEGDQDPMHVLDVSPGGLPLAKSPLLQ